MVSKILLWLPADKNHKQHRRLRLIMLPLCRAFEGMGRRVEIRSMLDDDFDADPDCTNIWLATELGEGPPRGGVNILWFLTQMKVLSQPVLMQHDAIVTASQDHATFLRAWLGDHRHIGMAGWPVPVPPVPVPALRQTRKPKLELEPMGAGHDHPVAKLINLPVELGPLQSLFAGFDEVYSNLPLRERMCGFCRYEEIVALMAGCAVTSQERRGLPAPLDAMLGGKNDGGPMPAQSEKQIALLSKLVAIDTVAAELMQAVIAAEKLHHARQSALPNNESYLLQRVRHGAKDEWRAFIRDATYILHHPTMQQVLSSPPSANTADLSKPWGIISRIHVLLDQVPLPWTCLSLIRYACDAVLDQQLSLTQEDRQLLWAVAWILTLYRSDISIPPAAIADLPAPPWQGVSTASQDNDRICTDISRALNGHNLYNFSQSVGKPKFLSEVLGEVQGKVMGERLALPDLALSRVAIFLHAYYVDIAKNIIDFLPAILGKCRLYITTDTQKKADYLRKMLQEKSWPSFEVRLVENKGRDIYPKMLFLADAHRQYDFVLHLHTKKSPHSESLKNWGGNSIRLLAGSEQVISRVLTAFADDDKLGLVYSDPPKILHPAMSWTRNLRLAEMLAASMGLRELPESDVLDFPVGSMFWVRTAAIKQAFDTPITGDFFPLEAMQEDGTLAHAFERVTGALCIFNQYKMQRITLESPS